MTKKSPRGSVLKQKNYSDIFEIVRRNCGIARQDIVMELQLSLPTVTQNLEALIDAGLVEEKGSRGNTGGRKAKLYSIITHARTAIGLDITEDSVGVVVVNLQGSIIATLRRRLKFSPDEKYYQKLGQLVEDIILQAKLDRSHILGVGIGLPAMVTGDNQAIFYSAIPCLAGITCQHLKKYIPFPIRFYNDATSAGFIEFWAQSLLPNFFYISLSNYVGGSICINGQSYLGNNFRSAEVGQIRLRFSSSSEGDVNDHCNSSVLSQHTGGDLGMFFSRLKAGDPELTAVWQTYLEDLAQVVSTLRLLFDCTVILGGYVGEYIEDYIPQLQSILTGHLKFDSSTTYVCPCRYQKEAIAAGSALHFIDEFLQSV